MAKYIDADKLKAEIERRINAKADSIPTHGDMSIGDYATLGGMASLQDLLSFLSTLEVEEYVELSSSVDNYPKNVCPPSIECEKGMREPLESEKPMEDGLEEEIERYLPKIPENPYNEELRVFARHFAQWGAKHLKK